MEFNSGFKGLTDTTLLHTTSRHWTTLHFISNIWPIPSASEWLFLPFNRCDQNSVCISHAHHACYVHLQSISLISSS